MKTRFMRSYYYVLRRFADWLTSDFDWSSEWGKWKAVLTATVLVLLLGLSALMAASILLHYDFLPETLDYAIMVGGVGLTYFHYYVLFRWPEAEAVFVRKKPIYDAAILLAALIILGNLVFLFYLSSITDWTGISGR